MLTRTWSVKGLAADVLDNRQGVIEKIPQCSQAPLAGSSDGS